MMWHLGTPINLDDSSINSSNHAQVTFSGVTVPAALLADLALHKCVH